jgi:hypothetical protein
MTMTLTAPAAPVTSSSEDGLDHIYCCDPNVSLCGADISEEDDLGPVDIDELDNPCPKCEAIENLDEPCGVQGCPG